jgi:thiosulfate reductase cytochrome b subunit
VNLSTDESRTKPLLPDRLEQIGLQLGKQKTVTALRKEQRQMRNKELEGRQKLWRLGILAALVAVAIETGLSGRANQPVVSES